MLRLINNIDECHHAQNSYTSNMTSISPKKKWTETSHLRYNFVLHVKTLLNTFIRYLYVLCFKSSRCTNYLLTMECIRGQEYALCNMWIGETN